MKRILVAALVVQLVSLIRPLFGAVMYLRSRGSFAEQRDAIVSLFMVVE